MQGRLKLCITIHDKQLGYLNIVWDMDINPKEDEEDSARFTLQGE